jgi:hypothetical protein
MKLNRSDVPVLMIIFKRADTALKVIEAISRVKPKKLYIAADGPREGKVGEAEECKDTRDTVMKAIDWECEIHTLFREENLGCGFGPAEAISWFFQHEERGIILEDDCVPGESFFSFCAELLEHYKDDERIMHISGFNIQDGKKRGDASYYFSRYAEVWGWATWRRAWQLFDFEMKSYQAFLAGHGLDFIFPEPAIRNRWMKNFQHVLSENPTSIWDYRWMFNIWKENGLCITPNVCLVKNIGFDERAIHTKSLDNPFAKIQIQELTEITHPTLIIPNLEADAFTTAIRHHPPLLTRARLKMQYMVKTKFNA